MFRSTNVYYDRNVIFAVRNVTMDSSIIVLKDCLSLYPSVELWGVVRLKKIDDDEMSNVECGLLTIENECGMAKDYVAHQTCLKIPDKFLEKDKNILAEEGVDFIYRIQEGCGDIDTITDATKLKNDADLFVADKLVCLMNSTAPILHNNFKQRRPRVIIVTESVEQIVLMGNSFQGQKFNRHQYRFIADHDGDKKKKKKECESSGENSSGQKSSGEESSGEEPKKKKNTTKILKVQSKGKKVEKTKRSLTLENVTIWEGDNTKYDVTVITMKGVVHLAVKMAHLYNKFKNDRKTDSERIKYIRNPSFERLQKMKRVLNFVERKDTVAVIIATDNDFHGARNAHNCIKILTERLNNKKIPMYVCRPKYYTNTKSVLHSITKMLAVPQQTRFRNQLDAHSFATVYPQLWESCREKHFEELDKEFKCMKIYSLIDFFTAMKSKEIYANIYTVQFEVKIADGSTVVFKWLREPTAKVTADSLCERLNKNLSDDESPSFKKRRPAMPNTFQVIEDLWRKYRLTPDGTYTPINNL